MMLFDNLSNNFNSTNKVSFVGVLYSNANTISIKQCVDLEFMRVQKVRFWIWSDLQTSGNMKGNVSKFRLEKIVVLK